MELVDGFQDRCLSRIPAVRARPYALDVLARETEAQRDPLVLGPLVVAAAERGDTKDHELRVAARKLAAGHQPRGEAQPRPEQAAVPAERREDRRRANGPGAEPDD